MFDEDRYFDVFVEYAKASRGHPDPDHRPQPRAARRPSSTSCRRCGSATSGPWGGGPAGSAAAGRAGTAAASSRPSIRELGERYLYCEGDVPLLFTENETNTQRIFGVPNRTPYVKDGINNYVVHGQEGAVNPEKKRDQGRGPLPLTVKPGECQVVRLRLTRRRPGRPGGGPAGRPVRRAFDDVSPRGKEAGRVLRDRHPASLDADAANVMRQALAGMLWSKQFYHYDVDKWLEERGSDPFKAHRKRRRATTTGTTCTTATSSRCRTSGSTRGTRPGTSPSTSSP